MKNKNTIAKLLAEEDIFVVHKQMETAYFDVKNRELGLPIWKENTMTHIEEELLICHEIGHALWTPLDMMEKTQLRKIEHSVVNVLEDARIEKKVMNKYLGTIRIFKEAYNSLAEKDFFGINGKNIHNFNLVDRINLHYKNVPNIPFGETEEIWVEKAGKTVTPDDVLDLAEELIAWMNKNPESMGEPDESGDTSGESMGDPIDGSGSGSSGESGDIKKIAEELADAIENGSPEELSKKVAKFKDEMEKGENDSSDTSGDDAAGNGDDGIDGNGNDDASETKDDSNKEVKSIPEKDDVIEGGEGGSGAAAMPNITAETADKFGKSLDEARDKDAAGYNYVRVNDLDLNKISVSYKEIVSEFNLFHSDKKTDRFFVSTLEEITEKKKTAKKTVAYMVKEFEMKKSADQYARASESKTGSLDMGKLHTYKYNEDLFKKVTTLPGATNHGLVMCLDWSGSMATNLRDTLSQLFNLVWFCRRTQIPFEVYAFSDRNKDEIRIEVGAFDIRAFSMLNFFSSKMTSDEEMKMMHYLWMAASRWGYRDWKVDGYPLNVPARYELGGTPLNEAIIAMMKIVPKFKKENNLQKVHSVFLTDGCGSSMHSKSEWRLDTWENSPTYGEQILSNTSIRDGKCVITDPVTNKTLTTEDKYWDATPLLLNLLKKRVPEMNVVGFFVAGTGRKGTVKPDTLRYAVDGWAYKYNADEQIRNALRELKKNNVFMAPHKGYDSYFILPGSMEVEEYEMSNELVGASKAKLKTAFGKSTAGRISSRPLLNKFVEMVA